MWDSKILLVHGREDFCIICIECFANIGSGFFPARGGIQTVENADAFTFSQSMREQRASHRPLSEWWGAKMVWPKTLISSRTLSEWNFTHIVPAQIECSDHHRVRSYFAPRYSPKGPPQIRSDWLIACSKNAQAFSNIYGQSACLRWFKDVRFCPTQR